MGTLRGKGNFFENNGRTARTTGRARRVMGKTGISVRSGSGFGTVPGSGRALTTSERTIRRMTVGRGGIKGATKGASGTSGRVTTSRTGMTIGRSARRTGRTARGTIGKGDALGGTTVFCAGGPGILN